jgi:hypothetical protein
MKAMKEESEGRPMGQVIKIDEARMYKNSNHLTVAAH